MKERRAARSATIDPPAPVAPVGTGDVVTELRHRFDELTQSQKRIAEAIVEDPEFVAFATVDKLASKLGVSPSTVVRFAYRLGLEGYQDLQARVRVRVRSQLRTSVGDGGEARMTSHLGDSVFARSFDHDVANLRKTVVGLSSEDLDRAVDVIASARHVHVIGAVTSFAVAYYAALALDRIRGETTLLNGEDHALASQLVALRPNDALLIYTFPPYASSSLRAAKWAHRQKAQLIAVTDTPISPVGQLVQIVLPTIASGVGAQNSLVAAIAVTNALLNGVTLARKTDALERYGRVMKLMNDWDQFVLKPDD